MFNWLFGKKENPLKSLIDKNESLLDEEFSEIISKVDIEIDKAIRDAIRLNMVKAYIPLHRSIGGTISVENKDVYDYRYKAIDYMKNSGIKCRIMDVSAFGIHVCDIVFDYK